MFITLTLNPAMDQTLTVEGGLALGKVHAVRAETLTPGGKGVNVAKMLAANGKAVIAGGLLGEDRLAFYKDALTPLGIDCRFLPVPFSTRTNTMLTDGQGHELKLNRPGFPDLDFEESVLSVYVRSIATPGSIVTLNGSLPARFPPDTYARLIRLFHGLGCPTVVDSSGPALADAWQEKPEVIKPNRKELEAVLGETLGSDDVVRSALRKLMTEHEVVIVSDGALGAWFASRGKILFAESPEVPRVDTTGAGDTLLGQFCADYFPARVLTPEIAARAVAAGAAAVEQHGTPLISLERVFELAKRVVPVSCVP
jgi:1-phosphofructokinase family hexose kinase